MFVEKRKSGKSTKFYLVHSYRDQTGQVVKIRRFLGTNLSEKELDKLKNRATSIIQEQIKEREMNVFDFSLSPKELIALNKFNEKIEVQHLSEEQWRLFTEDFVYNTNAIEGSEVLRNEVPGIISKKETADEDELETKGVAKAVQFIRTTRQELSLNLILKLHKFCFEKTKDYAGKFRTDEVIIKNRDGTIMHEGTPAHKLDYELKMFVQWYKQNNKQFRPLVLAAIIHNQFEDIHPFEDGNGRVGRLLLNFILIKNNYPPINILLEDRAEYYQSLYEYSQNDKLRPTLHFLIKQYKKTSRQLKKLERIKKSR